jgi:hypothetical protein
MPATVKHSYIHACMLLCMNNKVHTLHAHMPDPGVRGSGHIANRILQGGGNMLGYRIRGGEGEVMLFWNEQFEGIFKTALGYSTGG